MVAVGLTVIGVPLNAVRLPGVITPLPCAKTPVKIVLWPALMVEGLATKLEIVGAGSTVTVRFCVTAVPVAGVTVRV